jgi:hypothetical protein
MPEKRVFETAHGRWLLFTKDGVIDLTGNTEVLLARDEIEEFLEWLKQRRIETKGLK